MGQVTGRWNLRPGTSWTLPGCGHGHPGSHSFCEMQCRPSRRTLLGLQFPDSESRPREQTGPVGSARGRGLWVARVVAPYSQSQPVLKPYSLSSKSHWATNPPGLLFSWTFTWSTLWGTLAQKTEQCKVSKACSWLEVKDTKTPGHLLSPRSAKMAEAFTSSIQRQ